MQSKAASDAEGVLRGHNLVSEAVRCEPLQGATDHPDFHMRIAALITSRVSLSPALHQSVERLDLRLANWWILISTLLTDPLCHPVHQPQDLRDRNLRQGPIVGIERIGRRKA